MDTINYDDFSKLNIRIGTIISVEKVEDSRKLLKIQVDIGDKVLQILSGLAMFYTDFEKLVGLQVPVLVNLEPKVMAGLESQGMILMAGDDIPMLITPLDKVENGAIVR